MSLATRIAQEFNNVRSHISGITATHLLGGNLSVSNKVITNGFSTTLHTGNGGTQAINTGVDMSTQWGNDTSEQFGGLVWLKSRSAATNNFLFDTIRGTLNEINSNTTEAQASLANSLTAFNNNGFSVGSAAGINVNAATYTSWNFQTTHRRTGTTNHGKAYTEHYNPFTGFTILKYEGSGIVGHEIPHSLGKPLEIIMQKDLNTVSQWLVSTKVSTDLGINTTASQDGVTRFISTADKVVNSIGTGTANVNGNQTIVYGWANSYYDETNKLIGNYEIGVYQGTGVAGNKVTTRGKPVWVMIKRLDVADSWLLFDNQRVSGITDGELFAHTSQAEVNGTDFISLNTNDFTINIGATGTGVNASGGQYLYMVVYDNDSGSGKSKYPKATDTSNVQINNAIIPLAHGVDSNGSKNSIVVANETITGLTYTQGKNYLYKTDTGYGVKPYEPRYLSSELVRRFAGEQPDYYDGDSNKWFNTDAGSELVVNGTFSSGVTTGWTPNNAGVTLSVVNSRLNVNQGLIDSGYAYQQISTIVGKRYKFKATFESNVANTAMISVGKSIGSAEYIQATIDSATAITIAREFIAETLTTFISIGSSTGLDNFIAKFDDISVFQTDIVPTTEITESRNYLNHIVHADQNGQVVYVEELPKIEYKDIIKANEFKGKNACTAWVDFDGTTAPPTKKDGHKISSAIKTNTASYDLYFETQMDNLNYGVSVIRKTMSSYTSNGINYTKYLNKVNIELYEANTQTSSNDITVIIFGGKN